MTRDSLALALRHAFPHAGAHEHAPYCVGASIRFYVGAVDDPFPDENELACHLEEIRGSLLRAELGKPRRGFLRRATCIIEANDDGNPDEGVARNRGDVAVVTANPKHFPRARTYAKRK